MSDIKIVDLANLSKGISVYSSKMMPPGAVFGMDMGNSSGMSYLTDNTDNTDNPFGEVRKVTMREVARDYVRKEFKDSDVRTIREIAAYLQPCDAAPLLNYANKIERLLKGEG